MLSKTSGLLNSRSLGYVSSDPKDPRPLTPNDFLNRPSIPLKKVGDVVLLIEKNISRGQWSTGRVVKTYSGLDELVRVVDVITSDGICKRAIRTLCLLTPIEEETGLSTEAGNPVFEIQYKKKHCRRYIETNRPEYGLENYSQA